MRKYQDMYVFNPGDVNVQLVDNGKGGITVIRPAAPLKIIKVRKI